MGRPCERGCKGGCFLLPPQEMQSDELSSSCGMGLCCVWSSRVLPSPCVLFRFVLLETDGAPEVLAALQVFTSCLVEALKKENEQVHLPGNAA